MEHALGQVFSNLAKACEKQYRAREAELFWKVADYFDGVLPESMKSFDMGLTLCRRCAGFPE
ncbi:hypothetical protein [Rectinema subterraneum]